MVGFESPGLFDLQVNGYAGIDFNDAGLTADGLDHALRAMLAAGVTRCLLTLITAAEDVLLARFAALDRAVRGSRLAAAMVPGYHLEGPFLNPAPGFRGCHPAEAMVLPDLPLLQRLVEGRARPVLLWTTAPERPGAAALVRWAAAAGIAVAIGHADAGGDVVAEAVAAGARASTHLGNGLPPVLPKLSNPLLAQLAEDRLVACFIADGVHVPPPALRVMIRAKGPRRAALVTDAVAAAAAPPGRYGFAGMAIDGAADGSVRTPGTGTLAGSALTLDQAVRNVAAWGIAPPAEAAAMASAVPAGLVGLVPAGAVRWDAAMRVVEVAVDGQVFRAGVV